ncbi:MAG: ribosomal protein L7/L12, partial [Anaerolineales bacterium]|nr:ribosomal protein L7/L12 [Anaerolineales bacterium]
MTTTFNCPTCGAPLAAPPDSATTIKCQHCGNTVVVPETLRSDTPETAAGQTAAGPRRWSLELLLEQPGQLRELARLVQAGQKIEAIKLYRQLTGAGLKEAKDSVEQLAAGQLVQVSQVIIQETVTGRPDMAEIRRLLLAGKKIEAIKLYRQATGLGLKESKDVIETFEGKLGDAGPEPAVVVTTPLDADVMVKLAEVRNILATGDKLAAIKRFRQHFQCGLAEAKEAVEAMAHGQPVPPWTLRPTPAAAPARRANRRPNTAGGWFAALGGILSLGLCILLAGSGPLMLSGAFRQAAGLAVNDPAVRAALGTPVNVVWWRLAWGQINCGSRCSSNFSFYVAGPKGEARVQVLSDSSGGFPFVGEGEWTPDLRYYLPDQTQALGVTATPRPRPATPTFSVAELDATAGALARATRQAESRATAAAQADRDATATALADETQAAQATATQMRRAAQSVL